MPTIKICDRCGDRQQPKPGLGQFYHEVALVRMDIMNPGERHPYWLLCETCERLLFGEIQSKLLPNIACE